MNILEKANDLVNGDRSQSYGSPLKDFTRVAKMWSVILGFEVDANKIPLCMIALKISRECNSAKKDNLVDIAGYAHTLEKLIEERSLELGDDALYIFNQVWNK